MKAVGILEVFLVIMTSTVFGRVHEGGYSRGVQRALQDAPLGLRRRRQRRVGQL